MDEEKKTMICLEDTVKAIRLYQKTCGYAWNSNYQKGIAAALRIVLREGEDVNGFNDGGVAKGAVRLSEDDPSLHEVFDEG